MNVKVWMRINHLCKQTPAVKRIYQRYGELHHTPLAHTHPTFVGFADPAVILGSNSTCSGVYTFKTWRSTQKEIQSFYQYNKKIGHILCKRFVLNIFCTVVLYGFVSATKHLLEACQCLGGPMRSTERVYVCVPWNRFPVDSKGTL